MKIFRFLPILILTASPVLAQEQEGIDACIDGVRAETGGLGGTVLASSFSEAGTLVVLEDADGTIWRCIGYRDGTLGELVVDPSAAELPMVTLPRDQVLPISGEIEVQFAPGTNFAQLVGTLHPGDTVTYSLVASAGQEMFVGFDTGQTAGVTFQVIGPDGTTMAGPLADGESFRGDLTTDGAQLVEVMNDGTDPAPIMVYVEIN